MKKAKKSNNKKYRGQNRKKQNGWEANKHQKSIKQKKPQSKK